MANAFSYERIAAIEKTLDDIPRHHVLDKALGEVLGSICAASRALVRESECLAVIRKIVAAARKDDADLRPDLDILEYILNVPLYVAADDGEASSRVLAVADVALALYRLADDARE